MLVAEIMVEDVVVCDPDTTLRTAGKRMLDRGAGSVVVVRDGVPVGILTETDTVRVGVVTDRSFDDVAVSEVASHPVVRQRSPRPRRTPYGVGERGKPRVPVTSFTHLPVVSGAGQPLGSVRNRSITRRSPPQSRRVRPPPRW